MRRQKDREKRQKKARKREQREPEKKNEDLHEMAPGVPTGPGEEVRGAGAFPGLIIQTEDKDYRGMNREPPKGGPPFVVPPFSGVPGRDSGEGQETSSYQNETGLFSGPQNQQKENQKQTSGMQPGPGTVGQLQAGE